MPFCILSLDGRGIREIISATILASFGKPF